MPRTARGTGLRFRSARSTRPLSWVEALEARRLLSALVSGERVLGSIVNASDTESFTFSANAGDSLVVTLGEIASNWAPRLDLFAPGGDPLGSVSGSASAGANNYNMEIELLDVLASGTYTAVVSGVSGSTGDFALSMARVPGAQPFDSGPLHTGQRQLGSIARGDLDVFTFAANAGESVVLSIGELFNWAPRLDVFAPGGALLDSVAGSASAGANNYNMQIDLPNLAESGTYYALVRSASQSSTGDYAMTMMRLPGPQPLDAGPLVSGGRATGTIDRGDLDVFTFTAAAGDTVLLSIGELANWAPQLDVYSPGGVLLDSVVGSGSAGANNHNMQIELSNLAEGGTYYALVRSASQSSTGDYAMTLLRLPLAQPFDDGPLVSGARNIGSIDRGDLDVFTFAAGAGDSILLSMGELTNWAPQLDIYSPDGVLLDSVAGSGSAGANNYNMQIELSNLAQGGTYYAVARAAASTSTGNYTFTMLRLPAAQPFDHGPLLSNQRRFGSIDRGDLDVFSFSAAAGDSVLLSVGELFNWAPRLDVYSPAGVLLDSVAGSGSAGAHNYNMHIELLDLAEGGTYYAVMRSAGGTSLGDYVLSLAALPGPQADDTTDHDGGPIASGQTTSAAIAAGDLDVYTLVLAAGSSATIQMTRLTGTFTPKLDLFGPDGARLATHAASPTATINLPAAPVAGTYYIVARTSSAAAVGNYAIAVDTAPGADVRPPEVTQADFLFDAPRQQVVFLLNESVAGSVEVGDMTLLNLTTGQTIPNANMTVSFNVQSNQIIYEFQGYPFRALPDGDYRATLNAGSVQDAAGNPLAAEHSFEFFFLQGDANRDRRVNLQDFNRLAGNFGRGAAVFSQGDFNYDGFVNLQDFNVLAGRFGASLGPSASAPAGVFAGGDGAGTRSAAGIRATLEDEADDPLALTA